MALNRILEDSGGVNSSLNSITTNSVSPPSDCLLIIWIAAGAAQARTITSVTTTLSNVGTWTIINNGGNNMCCNVAYALVTGAPGSGTITANISGTSSRRSWGVVSYTGHDTTTPIPENNTATGSASTLSVSLTDVAAGNEALSGVCSQGDGDGVTPGSGETELFDVTSTGSNEARLQVQYSGQADHDWSGLNTVENMGTIIEVAVAPAAGNDAGPLVNNQILKSKVSGGLAA